MTQFPTIDAGTPLSTAPAARARTRGPYLLVKWMLEGLFAAAFVIGVYEALVAGEIHLWPNAPDSWILPMWVLAATISGLGLGPVRRLADRLLRMLWRSAADDPYAALAAVVAEARLAAPTEDALARLAEIAVEGTGAQSALVRRARSGEVEADRAFVFPIRVDGDILGELVLKPALGRGLTKSDRALAASLADVAASVLRNARLTEELSGQLRLREIQAGELDRSRRRIVAARDEAREQLGREIQSQVGTTLFWGASQATALLESSEAEAEWGPRLAELTERIDASIKDFRRIVHGVYPATLTDHGLAAALGNLVADLPEPTTFSAPDLPRFEPRYEAGVYFCVAMLLGSLEGIAGHVEHVEVALREDALCVQLRGTAVNDHHHRHADPVALEAIRDRVAALDGELSLASEPGSESGDASIAVLVIPRGDER